MLRSIFLSLKQLFASAVFRNGSIDWLRLLVKNNSLELQVSPFSVKLFQNIREFGKNILQTIELLIQFNHLLLKMEVFLVTVSGDSPGIT